MENSLVLTSLGGFIFLYWPLLQFFTWTPQAAALSYSSMNISVGAYKQELPSPIFYESFIPIIYEYTVPKYSTLDITLRDWREKCKTENFAPSYTCPVFYHYEKYLERFEAEVVPRAWANDLPNNNVPSVPRVNSDFCNSIQRHFPGSITQQFGFEEYVEKLQKCPLGELLIKRAINDYVFNIKQLFKSMNKNYENEFSNSFLGAANSKLSPAFYVNAVTTHQNGMLVAYTLEKDRWNEAELSCNSQLIPNSLVRVENLTASLNSLRQILKSHNLASSVPIEETSAFYKVPITDCSYIENNGNFVVRIQIPVMRKELAPALYKLETVPFVYDDDKKGGSKNRQLCQIQTEPITYVFDKLSGVLQKSKCNLNSPLCKLEHFTSSDVVSPCVASLFSESLEGVKKYCEMTCIPWREMKNGLKMLPAFHQTKPDTWLVTGHPLTGVAIKCQGKQDIILEHPETGALEVKVPCSCYLAYHSDSYYPQSSCQDNIEPIVKHILPVHFIRDDKLEEIMKLTMASPSENEVSPSVNVSDADYVMSSFVQNSLDGNGNNRAQSSAHVATESNEGYSGGSITFLWVVIVIQSITFLAIAAVAIYKYADRRKKLNAFSKERLVYNVYPSTSNPNVSSASTSSDSFPYAPSHSQRSSVNENNLNIM